MDEKAKPGDTVTVITCRHCQHTVQVLEVVTDPEDSFGHQCPRCGKTDRYSASDLKKAVAHRKQ